ncbi:hypothetical protein PALB_12780 [Pseudoalteromonas luteoviolacea B = ATCC 29581]|nr:hypothetical protein PALB_12780 [Pseudoalteromonas luteoviolacea B = ATCC 29581]
MEYQFINDPLFGIRCKMNDEHALIGRWLTDEVGCSRIEQIKLWINEVEQSDQSIEDMGKEIRMVLSKEEAVFEAHLLFCSDESQLEAYRDDQLSFDDEGLCAACGFEDFKALINDFSDFVTRR